MTVYLKNPKLWPAPNPLDIIQLYDDDYIMNTMKLISM